VVREIYMSEKYQCCFCGLAIEPVLPDVGGILYTPGIDCQAVSRHDQQLWCHTKCLAERLHPSAKLDAVDLLERDLLEGGG
jgi:hypothetical protein